MVSRWLWPGNRTYSEVASMVVTWWIVGFFSQWIKRQLQYTYVFSLYVIIVVADLPEDHLWRRIAFCHAAQRCSFVLFSNHFTVLQDEWWHCKTSDMGVSLSCFEQYFGEGNVAFNVTPNPFLLNKLFKSKISLELHFFGVAQIAKVVWHI